MTKQVVILFFLKIIKIPINLLTLSLTAKYFGVNIEQDVWLLTYASMIALDSILWGAINETFRAKFIFIKGEMTVKKAIYDTQSLITYFVIFSFLLILFLFVFSIEFSELIAPNYNCIEREKLIDMIKLALPILLFNQLMQIGISILNAFGVFYVAENSAFVSSLINIIIIILLHNQIGIYALLVAYYVSTLVLILFILYFIRKNNIDMFSKKWNIKIDGFSNFIVFALPFYLPYLFGQLNSFVEKILAVKLGNGYISIIDYSNRIPNLMYGFISSIIMTILVPVLSKHFIQKENKMFNNQFEKMFQLGFLAIGLIIAFLVGNSSYIVSFMYNKGSISINDLQLISQMSVFYGFTLLGIFCYVLFGMSLLASKNQKTYAYYGMLTQGFVIIINFSLIRIFNVYIFPISIMVSHTIFAYLMYRKYPYKQTLNLKFLKYFFILILLSLSIYFINRNSLFDSNLLNFVFNGFSLLLLFVFLGFIFKIDEFNQIEIYLKIKKNNSFNFFNKYGK